MNAREELFGLILGRTTTKAVERILAAGYSKPRTITTAEELEQVQEGARLLSTTTGHVWWRHPQERPQWAGSGGYYSYSTDFLSYEGPFTVLHTPKES